MNWSAWFNQIVAIVRLEMSKTFLSRRGLWIYFLALAPVALTTIHSLVEMTQSEQRKVLAAARPADTNLLASIERGMTEQQVLERAGQPQLRTELRRSVRFSYTDGTDLYTYFFFPDDAGQNILRGINIERRDTVQQDTLIYASIFQFFYLRLAIFFGCVGVFTNLFRGELLDKSLHYYLLTPVRREVLVLGKYLSGLIATVTVFTISTALQMWTLSWHFESSEISQFLGNDGWHQALAYLGVTVAACVGYGSVFLVAGLIFKNPILPAAVVEAWESANIFLPAALKQISVIYYLQSLCPIVASPDQDMNRFLKLLITAAEPVSVPVAIIGLLIVSVVMLAIGGQLARRIEINYSTD